MRGIATQQTVAIQTPPGSTPTISTNHTLLMGSVVILLPILVILGSVAHKRRRQAILRRQIARLEKMWLLSCR